MTSEYLSTSQHLLDTRVHCVFVNELAAPDLVQANRYFTLKPFVMSQHFCYGFADQVVGSPAGSCSQFIQFVKLTFC